MYQNIRGLRTKLSFFRNYVLNINCNLLLLSETWLCFNISDYELGLTKFTAFRADTIVNLSRGGGVLLAVKNNLNSIRIAVKNIPGIEQVFVSLKLNDIILLIGCVYIPPNTHSDIYYEHCEVVENIIVNHSFDSLSIIVYNYLTKKLKTLLANIRYENYNIYIVCLSTTDFWHYEDPLGKFYMTNLTLLL